jgi:hypothetical protein
MVNNHARFDAASRAGLRDSLAACSRFTRTHRMQAALPEACGMPVRGATASQFFCAFGEQREGGVFQIRASRPDCSGDLPDANTRVAG